MINCYYGKLGDGMTIPKLKLYPKQLTQSVNLDDQKIDFWICSCCGQVFDGDQEQPVNNFGNELFECALCDVVNAERESMETN